MYWLLRDRELLTAGAAALTYGSAIAADNAPEQRIVRFGDLNLNHEEGIRTLYRRLASAARAVCEPKISVPVTVRSRVRKCQQTTIATAVKQINNANLTAYHDRLTGQDQAGEAELASRH